MRTGRREEWVPQGIGELVRPTAATDQERDEPALDGERGEHEAAGRFVAAVKGVRQPFAQKPSMFICPGSLPRAGTWPKTSPSTFQSP